MSKCVKCKKEYNHYRDICPRCRGARPEDVLGYTDDIDIKDPFMEDYHDGNHERDDPVKQNKPSMVLGNPGRPLTKGTRS
jgi:hypothetical protein